MIQFYISVDHDTLNKFPHYLNNNPVHSEQKKTNYYWMHLRGMGNQENQYLVLKTIMSGGTGWEVEGFSL